MAYMLEKMGTSRCALDAAKIELFTQKTFADLIYESTAKGQDYILTRVNCKEKDSRTGNNIYYCYDGKQLCKHVFEMLITSEGRKIRMKNFVDPSTQKQIAEINFFKLKHDSETPLKAEFIGNQTNFLDSNNFRYKIFQQEDPLDALSVNFQFKALEKVPVLKKKRIIEAFLIIFFFLLVCLLGHLLINNTALGRKVQTKPLTPTLPGKI